MCSMILLIQRSNGNFITFSQSTVDTTLKQPQATSPLRSPRRPTIAAIDKKVGNSVRELLRSPSDYFPMIRRGAPREMEKADEVASMGWSVEVTSRKEREEALRYVLPDVSAFCNSNAITIINYTI